LVAGYQVIGELAAAVAIRVRALRRPPIFHSPRLLWMITLSPCPKWAAQA